MSVDNVLYILQNMKHRIYLASRDIWFDVTITSCYATHHVYLTTAPIHNTLTRVFTHWPFGDVTATFKRFEFSTHYTE